MNTGSGKANGSYCLGYRGLNSDGGKGDGSCCFGPRVYVAGLRISTTPITENQVEPSGCHIGPKEYLPELENAKENGRLNDNCSAATFLVGAPNILTILYFGILYRCLWVAEYNQPFSDSQEPLNP